MVPLLRLGEPGAGDGAYVCVIVPICTEDELRFSARLENKVTLVRFEWVARQTRRRNPEASQQKYRKASFTCGPASRPLEGNR